MPYELSFTAPVQAGDPAVYINDCCWGGDVIRDRLLPIISRRYGGVMTEQEDWGWFIWFREGQTKMAVDIFCDDIQARQFRVRLTSRQRKWLFLDRIVDTPQLDELRQSVVTCLSQWVGPVTSDRVTD